MENEMNAEAIQDILLLVEYEVPIEVIEEYWTDEMCKQALLYADSICAYVSDNYDVEIPDEPDFIKAFKINYNQKEK